MKFNLQSELNDALKFITDYMSAENIDKKDSLMMNLMCEDILGHYLTDPSYNIVDIQFKKRKTKISFSICIPGKKLCRLNYADPSEITSLNNFYKNADVRYHYSFGKNVISGILNQSEMLRYGFSFIWHELINNKKHFIIATSLDACEIIIGVVLPVLSAQLINAFISDTIKKVLLIAVIMLLIRLIFALIDRISQYFYNKTIGSLDYSISSILADKILSVKTEKLQNFGTSVFYQKITNDVDAITGGLRNCISLTGTAIQQIGTAIAMGLISPIVLIYQIFSMTVLGIIEFARTRAIKDRDRQYSVIITDFLDLIKAIINGNREIKLYNKKTEFVTNVNNANDKCLKTGLDIRSLGNRYGMIKNNVAYFFSAGYVALLALLLYLNKINPSEAVILFNYSIAWTSSSQLIEQINSHYKDFSLSCERIFGFIYSDKFASEQFGDLNLRPFSGAISFKNVKFSYPSLTMDSDKKYILDDMSFDIHSGEYVAITGLSGCGKTTIFNLIMSLYRTAIGSVCLDGHDIKSLDEQTIRDNISMVPQNPYFFQMSIRENLLIAKPDATVEEITKACSLACIHQDIIQMKNGYDSVLTEGGGNISGGQRQRLAIAMVILRNTPIILLDEATSALDNITQDRIQNNLTSLSGKHTIVVIAHRLSTIVNCNKIMYIENGRVEAIGTHKELIDTCSNYKALYMEEFNHANK